MCIFTDTVIWNIRGENPLENTDLEDREGDERTILKLI
jgi:hypothetical protein